MSHGTVIAAEGLGKQYRRPSRTARHDTLRDLLASAAKGLVSAPWSPAASETFWALQDVGFEVRRGENVGIIGLNGAGKSTLLKILSRITAPTTGRVRIAGRVGSLLEVGTGFHGELSGRENIYLYGSILGMPQAEVRRKFDAIVAFAGVESFVDMPVKRYSSGMYTRLAFAVASHLEPDILILDEVLAVGDLAFQRKCQDMIDRLRQREATVLFVSHNMFSIKAMCSRAIYLRSGHIAHDGPIERGIELYSEHSQLRDAAWVRTPAADGPIRVTAIELLDGHGQPRRVFDYGESMVVRLSYEARQPIADPNFIVAVVRSDEVACCNFSTEVDGVALGTVRGPGTLELTSPPLKLVADSYQLHILVREADFQSMLCAQVGPSFHVRDSLLDPSFGVFHEPGEWYVAETGLRSSALTIHAHARPIAVGRCRP